MKKVFAILAVAGFMAACNSGENQEAATETPATEVATPDTTAASTDTTAAPATEAPAAQ